MVNELKEFDIHFRGHKKIKAYNKNEAINKLKKQFKNKTFNIIETNWLPLMVKGIMINIGALLTLSILLICLQTFIEASNLLSNNLTNPIFKGYLVLLLSMFVLLNIRFPKTIGDYYDEEV